MSEKLEKCPICKRGDMRPTGITADTGDKPSSFNKDRKYTEWQCDKCGHKRHDV